jgi:IclR family acetate operon transcriptional repressor
MEETGKTVDLAILDNDQVVYLEKVEGSHALRMPSRVGRHIPTYCTSLGKAMCSCLDEAEVRRVIQNHPIHAQDRQEHRGTPRGA